MKIKENDGFLTMKDLPYNCIFNKVKTGCGATTIALTNDENYIIAVPTTELIENKCYPTKDGKSWNKKDRKVGESPAFNLFGLYGNTTMDLKRKLKAYISKNGVKKIICTYDKIPYLMSFINPKEFRLLVDEYHHFLKSYSFRDTAIDGVLEQYKEFKSYCFMSATPIPADFKPNALAGINEEVADITVFPCKTNKPYMIAAMIIKEYQKDGYWQLNNIKSNEAYFFVNSVTDIKKIVLQTKLTNDDCRIICADNSKNKNTLGEEYSISSSTDTPKMFNFITSKSFEGVDYYSETGLCFVVSNTQNNHTLLSVDMDIPQIAGRIRTKTNPFRNKIVHIFNTRPTDSFKTYEDVKLETLQQLTYAEERADEFNNSNLSKGAKEQQINEIKKIGNNSYLKYDKKQDKLIANDMIGKLQLYAFMISDVVYRSGASLKKAYNTTKIVTSSVKWILAPENCIKKLMEKPSFRDTLKQYCEIIETNPFTISSERQRIEEKYPILIPAYQELGLKRLKQLRSIKGIKALL